MRQILGFLNVKYLYLYSCAKARKTYQKQTTCFAIFHFLNDLTSFIWISI